MYFKNDKSNNAGLQSKIVCTVKQEVHVEYLAVNCGALITVNEYATQLPHSPPATRHPSVWFDKGFPRRCQLCDAWRDFEVRLQRRILRRRRQLAEKKMQG